MAEDYSTIDKYKVTVEVSPEISSTGEVTFKGANIQPVDAVNINVLKALSQIVSDKSKALDLNKVSVLGGSSSQSSKGGKSKKNRKSKGGKSRKARKSLRRK
jgi:hypothetical protein